MNSLFNDSFLVSSLFRFVMSVVSSAKCMNLNNSLEWAMSFIYIMNKRGPKMEPWGTPIKISVFLDNVSPYWTNCFLFDKQLIRCCSAAQISILKYYGQECQKLFWQVNVYVYWCISQVQFMSYPMYEFQSCKLSWMFFSDSILPVIIYIVWCKMVIDLIKNNPFEYFRDWRQNRNWAIITE